MYDDLKIVNIPATNSFDMEIEDMRAFIEYKQENGVYSLLHTEVPKQLEGKGVAAALVEKTFHYLDEHNSKIKPYCAYIKYYLKQHPEWEKLIDQD